MNDYFWTCLNQSRINDRKNRDGFREDNWRRIQNSVKYLRRIFLQKQLAVFNHWLFFQNNSYYLFDRVMNMPLINLTKNSQKIRTVISVNLLLNPILSSPYYLAVRHWWQIQYTYLPFRIDSLLPLNTCNINQPLFTCSNSSQLLVISLVKVKKF